MKNAMASNAIRQDAESRFMCNPTVVGIAESRCDEKEITFFLSGVSKQLEKSIKGWAKNHDIKAIVRIVGQFQLLKAR